MRRAKGEGSLLRIKGTKFFYAQYYCDGRQIRVSTKTAVKAEALAFLREELSRRDKGIAPSSDIRKLNYGDLRAGLLANYQERGNRTLIMRPTTGEETVGPLKALDNFFKFAPNNPGPSVVRITTDLGRQFIKQRLEKDVSNATVNNSLALLKRMLTIAREDGKISIVPKIHLLKAPPARRGFVEEEEFEKLLGFLPSHLKPLVAFLYYCGVRVGEARQITWDQVDMKARVIRLEDEQTKTGEPRTVPLHSRLVALLTAIEPKVGVVFSAINLRKEWEAACARCGLGKVEKKTSEAGYTWYHYTGLMVHDLRRSAVRNLVNAGVAERVAMQISGHKTREVFDRYHIVSPADVTNAMRLVEQNERAFVSVSLVKVGRKAARRPRLNA